MDVAKDVNWHSFQGISKAKAGDFNGAVAEFSQAIQLAPNFAPLYYNRGRAYEDLGNVRAALADYTQALDLDPEYLKAYNNRALLSRQLGHLDLALGDWTTALRVNPGFVEARYNRAATHGMLGEVDSALKDLSQVIRQAPNFVPAYVERGRLGRGRRSFEETLADLNHALRLEPRNVQALYQRALTFLDREKPETVRSAIQDLDRAINLLPRQGELYQSRGLAYFKLAELGVESDRNYERAGIEFAAALRYGSSFAHYLRAQVHEKRGRPQKALDDLRAYLEKGGTQQYGNGDEVQALIRNLERVLSEDAER